MKDRLELLLIAIVVAIVHFPATIIVAMVSYRESGPQPSQVLRDVLSFPADIPDLLPDGWRQLLRQHWPEPGLMLLALNSVLWGVTVAAIVELVVRLHKKSRSAAERPNSITWQIPNGVVQQPNDRDSGSTPRNERTITE